MESSPEKSPSIKKQMDKLFMLRDRRRHQFVRYCIDSFATASTFASYMNLTYNPFLIGAERYLQITSALGDSADAVRLGLLGLTYVGVAATAVRMVQLGRTMQQMRVIQLDLQKREQETDPGRN